MPTYLAWDIGIKNLAYNIVDYDYQNKDKYKIKEWGIINLVEEEQGGLPENAITSINCCKHLKSGKSCSQKAKYIEPNDLSIGYCGKHGKEELTKKPNLIQVKSKMKCIQYNDKKKCVCSKNGIWLSVDNPYKRYCQVHYKSLIKNNSELEKDYYMDVKHASKIKQFNIKELSVRLFKALEQHPTFLEVDDIIIENQPVFKNPTMKSIQMLLYSYFVMNGLMKDKLNNISFFMAGKKLEGFQGNHQIAKDKFGHIKSEYKQTKNSAILFSKEMIKEEQSEWYDYICAQKKQDDLADAFLTNCCYIQNNYVKECEKEEKKKQKYIIKKEKDEELIKKKLEKEKKKLEKTKNT